MKKIITMSILAALMFVANSSLTAQRATEAKKGDYSCMEGIKTVNVIFVYDGMTVGKNLTEAEYVAEKVAEKNEKKAGSGDEWRKAWEKGKLTVYEPGFAAAFTKKIGKKLGIVASVGNDAPITIIVKTTRLEPGFNAHVVKRRAAIDMEMSFVDTDNHDNVHSTVFMNNLQGGDGYSVSDRVMAAYRGAGWRLAQYISKSLK